MNIQNVQNLQGLVRVITSIINIVWRMRLVEILLKIYYLLACFGYVAFSVQVGNSHEKISLQSYFLLLCVGTALVLVPGTVVAVLEGREDKRKGRSRREQEQKAW